MEREATPCGAISIITDTNGRVLATGADFDTQKYASYSIKKSQAHRAGIAAELNFAREMCSKIISDNIGHYLASKIVDELMEKNAINFTTAYVGYEDGNDE